MYKFKKIKASNGLGNGFETSGKNKKKRSIIKFQIKPSTVSKINK